MVSSVILLVVFLSAHSVVSGGSVVCPGEDGGYPVYIRNPNNCSEFYECSHGIPNLFVCPAGLVFNKRKHVCDSPDQVDCSDVSTTAASTTEAANRTSTPTPMISTTPSIFDICKKYPYGFFLYPYPYSCSLYISCDHGRATVMPCPAGLHFSPKIHVCMDPATAGCKI